MSLQTFVHLRVHTEYSLLDSVVRVPELMQATAAAGMGAIGLTDECNLFAMVKFYKAALAAGVKPIIGVDLWLAEGERQPPSRLTLLCQNERGYLNLSRLVSRAYLEGERLNTPLIERSWLDVAALEGLIALSGGWEGDVGHALLTGRPAQARRMLLGWQTLLGDRYYVELQRLGRSTDADYVAAAAALAAECGVPVVATNDVRFLAEDDYDAHEARVCIRERALLADANRRRRYTHEQYLRTPAEMAALFADMPAALANSVEIARRCSLPLKLGQSQLPVFPTPDGTSAADFLRNSAAAGLVARMQARREAGAEVPAEYTARLARELGVIIEMGFAGYFLIVADFIRWARENGVPVGPGRGSGAGSLVAWVLGITDLDPIAHQLLFERFLNPERVSMPDFDVDFCMEGRDRVIAYVSERYGRERVSQIITYGTMAAKAVVRDVARVLGHPFGFGDRIAKLIPNELDITLEAALKKEPELARLNRDDEDVRALLELALKLEGITRNAGKHAGGVVIAPSVLTDFTPLFAEHAGDGVVTQFDKDDVEAAGLVKFDFLGLRTLTIIDRAVRIVNALPERANDPVDLTRMPMTDPATFQLLRSGHTTAVFQLESRGMKDLIRRLKPDSFEDVVALVALFRPGPLQSGMVDDFIARKHSTSGGVIDYLHPSLQPVLEATYGVILYQEQVMQIAQVLSGYTLGGADLLRRAMGKKKAEEMAQQRSVFVDGAVARGVDQHRAGWIFDLIEKFAGYGFNKSHSAAYAVLTYQTAWLKAHYPAAFMAAVMSADLADTDKVVTLVDECKRMGLAVLPPDLNASGYDFTVAGEKAIRYGLGAVRGVGEQAVEALVQERQRGGPYDSLTALCQRIDLARVTRRVLEALIKAGAMDGLGPNRATLAASLDAAVQGGEQATRAIAAGQDDLFGGGAAVAAVRSATQPEWPESLRLSGERETLGLFLTGHPIQRFESDLKRLVNGRLGDLNSERPAAEGEGARYSGGRQVSAAGLVWELRKRNGRTSFVLDDRTGRIEVTLFEEQAVTYRDLLVRDALVLVEGNLRFDDFSNAWRIAGKRITLLDSLRETQARRLVLRWPDQAGSEAGAFVQRLQDLLGTSRPGPCEVLVRYRGDQARCTLALGADWAIRPTPALMDELESLVGREGLQLLYDPAGLHGAPSAH
ncbi:MAG TPA: DNA polymerase III subunit alpha [Steroidobacteraceae bacterium]|nr:DNA polymerase III subunit alpha [Steroidobacteraceae bacterium]